MLVRNSRFIHSQTLVLFSAKEREDVEALLTGKYTNRFSKVNVRNRSEIEVIIEMLENGKDCIKS
jgi:hypothetical protein